ncbi:MAG: GNAT family N-acetyltransferase [Bacteroidota bacterium]
MKITTLENISIDEIVDCFNEAFSDYIIPLQLRKEHLETKIASENVQFSLSVGAFKNDQLIGFMLHCVDAINGEKVLYNAGTGVIPTERGNNYTAKMYQFLLPQLPDNGINKIKLEVIAENKPALKTYQNTGFATVRELNCYKGVVELNEASSKFKILHLSAYDWTVLKSFWDCEPSFQNSIMVVDNLFATNISIGIFDDELLIGYLIYNPASKRIHQFAVSKSYRNKGVATQLFQYIASNYSAEMGVINVDGSSIGTNQFIESVGLKYFIKQYEMECQL